MLLLVSFFIGALFGWFRAHRAKLGRLDKLQYAAVFGIIFSVVSILGLLFFSSFLTA